MARVFRFDGFVLDTGALELRCGSVIVAVEPLVLDLITLLLERPGVVLSRDTLFESVWDGRIVSESTVSTACPSCLFYPGMNSAVSLVRESDTGSQPGPIGKI